MIVARGFVEIAEGDDIETVVDEIQRRSMDVSDVITDKVFFLFRRDNIDAVKEELGSLKMLSIVRNVHLTYYSIE